MALVIIGFIIGVFLIVKGGDVFVDASVWIARVTGIPQFIVGATVVSVATTLPELIVSIIASAGGQTDMAVGNAVGSVNVNIAMIMAISLIFMPGVFKRRQVIFKAATMICAAVLLWVFCLSGKMNIAGAVVMLCIFATFISENVISAKNSMSDEAEEEKLTADKKSAIINMVKFVLGAAGIVWGADLLVDNGTELARLFGVSEGIIGVTIIAVGTSLPELVTTITAIAKKQTNLSVGNIIGANIIDLTVILPICSIVSGNSLPVSLQSIRVDLPMCALVSAVALIPALVFSKFKKWQGILLLMIYIVYMYILCSGVWITA